ncbi:MAG: hypothetical protein RSC01_08800 [Oscillospiraceae bacterium]
MDLKNRELNAKFLEESKTAVPYSAEEMRIWDDEKDPARLFATLEAYAKKLESEGRTR